MDCALLGTWAGMSAVDAQQTGNTSLCKSALPFQVHLCSKCIKDLVTNEPALHDIRKPLCKRRRYHSCHAWSEHRASTGSAVVPVAAGLTYLFVFSLSSL